MNHTSQQIDNDTDLDFTGYLSWEQNRALGCVYALTRSLRDRQAVLHGALRLGYLGPFHHTEDISELYTMGRTLMGEDSIEAWPETPRIYSMQLDFFDEDRSSLLVPVMQGVATAYSITVYEDSIVGEFLESEIESVLRALVALDRRRAENKFELPYSIEVGSRALKNPLSSPRA